MVKCHGAPFTSDAGPRWPDPSMSDESIYYLSASVLVPEFATGPAARGQFANAIGHFYIKASSSTLAGAIASDMCRERGLGFVDYLCLPGVGDLSATDSLDEHRIAYATAAKSGSALVLSVILDNSLLPLDPTPFVT